MTITEVSKIYNLTPDTLRYYERIGLFPSVTRSKGGIRDYTEEDCKWVEFTKCMREAGLPVEVLIDYVALFQIGDETIQARKDILLEQRQILAGKIEEMTKTLEKLDNKILRYDEQLLVKERELKGQ